MMVAMVVECSFRTSMGVRDMSYRKVVKTERGWPGHFICADKCFFRRNTLLEHRDIRIVVSTVGLMQYGNSGFTEIGCDRHFETMAFHAQREQDKHWDADVTRQVYFNGRWQISDKTKDYEANEMHEDVVDEISRELLKGNTYGCRED
jgi:hypothetical protein